MRCTVFAGVVSFCLLGTVLAAPAGASISRKATSIPAESLDQALRELAKDRQFQVLYRADLVRDKRTAGAVGQFTPEEALKRLLAGTGLSYTYLDANTVTIVPVALQSAAPATQPDPPTGQVSQKETGKDSSQNFLVAQVDQASVGPQAVEEKKEEKTPALEEVVVTGTHIHNVAPIAPVITITHDDIVREGYTTVPEIIEQLVQNSLRGATPAANNFNAIGGTLAVSNMTLASSINLRGLGSNATLVLLNGHRMASSFAGYADISAIPVNIIDRIEIVTDGASSVYGADAVAGVVNIITKKDFSGVEVGAGLTGISEGKTPDHDANVLTGLSWNGGGFVASADYEKDNPLYARNRSFASGLPDPWALTPENEKMNLYLSAHQDFSDALTLSGDASITRRNFFFAADAYAQYGVIGPPETDNGRVNQYNTSLQLDYRISSDWSAALIGQLSKEQDHVFSYAPPAALIGFPDATASASPGYYRVSSLESRIDGRLFDLPGGAVRTAIGAEFLQENFENDQYNGTPGDPYGTEPGAPNGIPNGLAEQFIDSRHVSSAYGEFSIPLIGDDNRVPFARGLRINVSGRYDKYSDFGHTSNPRFALEWEPVANAKIHATYSRSFQVPTFVELSEAQSTFVEPLPDPKSATGSTLVAITAGGNPNLRPETAKSLNFGATYEPMTVPGLRIDASYFSVNFDHQIIQLSDFGIYSNSFLTQEAILGSGIVERDPSLSDITQVLNAPTLYNWVGGPGIPGPYSPSDIKAIVAGGFVNSAADTVAGEDVDVLYKIPETRLGNFRIDLDGSYFNKYEFNLSSTAPTTSFLNTTLNPLRFRAKVNFGWSKNAWGANARVNFSNSYNNTSDANCAATDNCSISSWTTVDLNAFYAPLNGMGPGWLDNSRVTLIVTNVFNRAPPRVTGLITDLGYDPFNANPLLRVFGVTFTKRFGGSHGQ
jgi:iron complex outermembrane receptor protein